MGNRFAGGIEPGAMPALHRYLGNPVLTFLGILFFKSPCGDFHCGLRGFDRQKILDLDLVMSGMEAANEMVTGTVGVRLFKGSARVVTRESPNAVYDAQLATFSESGGLFSQESAPGFIELWSLQSRMAWRVRQGLEG